MSLFLKGGARKNDEMQPVLEDGIMAKESLFLHKISNIGKKITWTDVTTQ